MISRLFLKPITVPGAVLSVLMVTACQKSGPPPVVLAQVDQNKLTLDEIRESFPSEYEKVLSREQYLDFIQRWINDEVVYQQALKTKLDRDPKVMGKLDRLKRKVLIEEFLARESASQEFDPDEGAMSRYYEIHKDEFRRGESEFQYLRIRLNSVKEAQALRAKVHGDNFAALGTGGSPDSNAEAVAPTSHTSGEIPACLRDLMTAKPGWISPPLPCPDGVYLVKLVGKNEAGTPASFAEAREAIRVQLSMEQKDKMREAKIRQYKEGAAVTVNLDLIPGQENSPEKMEDSLAPAP